MPTRHRQREASQIVKFFARQLAGECKDILLAIPLSGSDTIVAVLRKAISTHSKILCLEVFQQLLYARVIGAKQSRAAGLGAPQELAESFQVTFWGGEAIRVVVFDVGDHTHRRLKPEEHIVVLIRFNDEVRTAACAGVCMQVNNFGT